MTSFRYKIDVVAPDSVANPISFGSHNISEGKNEDRGSMILTHRSEGMPRLSSFSVFDGHNGSVAASACSQHFNRSVATRMRKLSRFRQTPGCTSLSTEERMDAIACESLRLSCLELDHNVKNCHKSGSTLVSLFLDWMTHDGDDEESSRYVRAYCANVGDSRCVLYTQFPAADELASPFPIPPTITKQGSVVCIPMSVDHKLSLRRERDRVTSRSPVEWFALPADIIKATFANPSTTDEADVIPLGYPPSSNLALAEDFILEAERYLDAIEDGGQSVRLTPAVYKTADPLHLFGALDKAKDSESAYKIVHDRSFIDRRRMGNIIGPEAIFSRYNLSINMTRSIGDKYASVLVVPVPEVVAINVGKNQVARFVLGSDGLWDVLSTEDVRLLVFKSLSAEKTSLAIAEEAYRRRVARRLRMDDISVIVVDVNMHLYKNSALDTRMNCDNCSVS